MIWPQEGEGSEEKKSKALLQVKILWEALSRMILSRALPGEKFTQKGFLGKNHLKISLQLVYNVW